MGHRSRVGLVAPWIWWHRGSSGFVDENPSEPDTKPVPQAQKLKGSAQLNRWSRARTIRSGKKLDLPDQQVQVLEAKRPPVEATKSEGNSITKIDRDDDVEVRLGKLIYMISNRIGWTTENSVNTTLGQFEHCLVSLSLSTPFSRYFLWQDWRGMVVCDDVFMGFRHGLQQRDRHGYGDGFGYGFLYICCSWWWRVSVVVADVGLWCHGGGG